jgi:F-type H+-transporting ATPase subunit b
MHQILEALGNIGFDWQVALANFVNFLIIFFILKKFAFKPLQDKLQERKKMVENGICNAEEAEESLKEAQVQAENIKQEARVHANKIVENARNIEATKINQAEDLARTKANQILEKGQKDVFNEKSKMMSEFRSEAKGLVSAAVAKIIGKNITEKEIESNIQELLKS